MDSSYDAFCAVDALFYDSLTVEDPGIHDFPIAGRPLPEGWYRHTHEDWWVYGREGGVLPAQGWKIHVSAALDNADRVLETAADYCLSRNIPFKFLRSPRMLLMRNSKYAHRGSSGKLVTIYPADETQLELILRELDEALAGEHGPYILSDLRYGAGPLYTRYGAFAQRFCLSEQGKVVPALADPSGTLVPDTRGPVFTTPAWVTLPAFLEEHLAARNATTTAGLPYQIERVLHFSNGGGLYVARDDRTGEKVVLKEARPYAGLDAAGDDAVTRIQRERDTLRRLADVDGVCRVHDYFQVGEHHFLALGYIEGRPLNACLVERYPLTDHRAGDAEFARYTAWATDVYEQVERIVAAINARGVVHGDLHLFNVMVRPDGAVVLIDFEVAAAAGDHVKPALRNQAFAAPSALTGVDVDRYALACLRLALFLPLTSMLRLDAGKAHHLAEVVTERFPVPPGFATEAADVVTRAATPAGPRSPSPRIEPDAGHWDHLRDQLATAILASATPERDDRLFPGDIEQFRSGGLGLAHGAAGVLYALAVTGAGRQERHERWLLDRATRPPTGTRIGLFDGLHGVAFALAHLGHRQTALDVLDICLAEPWEQAALDLSGGLAGIGLNFLHFGHLTGEPAFGDAARRAATLVAERLGDETTHPALSGGSHPHAGLMEGSAGPALLFLRMYDETGDRAYLDVAATALRQDLRRCVRRDDGALEVNEGWRTLPYLARGSAGIGLVLDEYLARRPDATFAEAAAQIAEAARSPLYVQSGLFTGRAGIVLYLARRDAHRAALAPDTRTQIRNLAWHALPYADGLAFPGEQLLRLSMDLATGTAGVLLALGAALHSEPVDLPLLMATRPRLTAAARAAVATQQPAAPPTGRDELIRGGR